MGSYVMQARSSTSGAMVLWLAASPDWAAASFPGPGTAQDIAVSSVPNAAGSSFVAGGDLSGSAIAQTVVGIQGIPVDTTDPTDGQIPKYNAIAGKIIWGAESGAAGSDETNALTITASPAGSVDMTGYGHLDSQSSSSAVTIGGFVAPAAGKAKRFTIHNSNGSSATLTLTHEDGAASAANRIHLDALANLVIAVGETYVATYSQSAQRWFIAKAGSNASAAGVAGDIQVRDPITTGFNVVGYLKATNNTGGLRATYWDPVDGVTLRSYIEVSGGGAPFWPAEQYPDYGFIRLADSFHATGGWSFLTVHDGVATRGLIGLSGGDFFIGDTVGAVNTDISGNGVDINGGSADVTINNNAFRVSPAGKTSLSSLAGVLGDTVNTSGLALDAISIDTSGGTVALTAAQASALRLIVTGTGGTLTAPDRSSTVYFVDASGCSGAVTINNGTAGGVTVAAGKCDIVYHDGTNYRSALSNAAGTSGITALANVGTGTGLVWRDTTSGTANLKTVVGGNHITITNNADEIVISTPAAVVGGSADQILTSDGSGNTLAPGPFASTNWLSTISGTPTNNGVRIGNNQRFSSRNAANTADLGLCYVDGSNNANFGSSSATTNINGALININNTGIWGTGSSNAIRMSASGLQFFGSASSLGGGSGVLGIANATTVPTSNPVGGGILFCDAGALKYKGTSSAVNTISPAEPHCPRCGTDVGLSECRNDFFGEHLIHCHACELKGRDGGVVKHITNFFQYRKVA